MVSTLPALLDSHCHLAFEAFDGDRPAVLQRARAAGLVGCLAVSVDPASAHQALALSRSDPGFVQASAGIHPTEQAVADPAAFEAVAGLIGSGAFVAVGETGLDAHHQRTTAADQLRSLDRHVRLALDVDLPLILHCRDAFAELLNALRTYHGLPLRGVLHCFTGQASDLSALLDCGLHIGAGGIATFKPRDDLRAALREVPDDRLLLETDAPWLAPAPHRGRRNEPAYVADIARHLAADRGQSLEHLAQVTTDNARRLFALP